MRIPQIIMILVYGLNIGINMMMHGKQRGDTYNVWVAIISSIINAIILYFGGFWG